MATGFRAAQIVTGVSARRYQLAKISGVPHVWLAHCLSDDQRVVVKTPAREVLKDQESARGQLDTEIRLLSGPLRGQTAIRQLLDRAILSEIPEVLQAGVYEYGEMTLHEFHFIQKRRLSPMQIRTMARQLLLGLASMHQLGIVHTDIKPENIVFTTLPTEDNPDLEVKLIDFGVAQESEIGWDDQKDNPYWRSPESWLGMPLTPVAEVWSLGAILGSLYMGPGYHLFKPTDGSTELDDEGLRNYLHTMITRYPFPESLVGRCADSMQKLIATFAATPKLSPKGRPLSSAFITAAFRIPPEHWWFIDQMLKVDPKERPSAYELLCSPWFGSARLDQGSLWTLYPKYFMIAIYNFVLGNATMLSSTLRVLLGWRKPGTG